MEYEQYQEKAKKLFAQSSKTQRVAAVFVLVIIASVGIYLYNPQKQLLVMRNSQRRGDVTSILDAAYQYAVGHGGNLPFTLTAVPVAICKSGAPACASGLDFSQIIASEKNVLPNVPVDPRESEPNISGYQISKSLSGRINVSAPLAENNAVISLSK